VFALKLANQFDHVLIYEQPDLQSKALKCIPVERLKHDAQSKHDSYKKLSNLDKTPYDLDDFVLIELLAWFKNDLFSWVNQPECEFCSDKNTVLVGMDRANHSELTWMANNVEIYQ
jgi:peptide-N4-(N-acetyl-beta-glucosaminyl)asparagine amidase